MIFTREQYTYFEDLVTEMEDEGSAENETLLQVSNILKDLIKIMKRSDKQGFNDITMILATLIKAVGVSSDEVQYLNEIICEYYLNDVEGRPAPKEGETAMINPDGSYVTLKELGIE